MRVIETLKAACAVLLIAAAPLDVACGAEQMVLPEVTVTAPPVVQAWRKFTPYFGNPRVEEDKWPDIPCGESRVAAGAATGCKTGPAMATAGIGAVNGNLSADLSNCRIAHDLVFTTLVNLAVEADVTVIDPTYVSAVGPPHKGCTVYAGYGDLREDFPDMNQMARKGAGWRNFAEYSDLSTMAFSVGASDCLAFEKRGPIWKGGYVSVIHASLCHNDGRPVDPAGDVARVLAALVIRVYEPRGNLRSSP